MDFSYEFDFENYLEEFFFEKYSLSEQKLQEYLILRYMIIREEKDSSKITLENFSQFIAEDIGISTSPTFTYKGSTFFIASDTTQSISNIIVNAKPLWWEMWGAIPRHKPQINKEYLTIISMLPVKVKRNKGKYKKQLRDFHLLSILNSRFNVEPKFVRFEGISELQSGVRTYEEICEAYVTDMVFDSWDNSLVLEKDIEEFLYKNLPKLLNYQPVQRQYQITDDCIADILARDENVPVIIEIKNANDQRLLWQLVKYHKHMPTAKIVAASTVWDRTLLDEILKLGYVQAFELKPHILMGKIDRLDAIELL